MADMDSNAIDQLNERFAIDGVAKIVAGQGGLPAVRITSAAASAEVYLHGGHVTAWRPAGAEDVIFVSAASRWEAGKPIRGGIPICFPWFGAKGDDAKAPQHGFARTSEWELVAIAQDGESVVVTLALESTDATRALWPYEFRAEYRVAVGAELRLELAVTNCGGVPFRFEEALHAYFHVGDVAQMRVAGLDGVAYLDKRDGGREKLQVGDVAMTAITDNVYLATASALTIEDPVLKRRIAVEKRNSLTTVVWNPWSDGAKALADMGDDEWREFVCVEACNTGAAGVELAPGQEHTMSAVIRIEA